MPETKKYLGDGVYIEKTEFGEFILTTENGISATNTIYLDSEVTLALYEYLHKIVINAGK